MDGPVCEKCMERYIDGECGCPSAPKRIWIFARPGERFWIEGPLAPDYQRETIGEYILAAEHDRIMAEKTAEIARLREALRRIDSDIGISILHHDDGLWETAYYRLKEVARAALGGDNG